MEQFLIKTADPFGDIEITDEKFVFIFHATAVHDAT